VLIIPSSWGSQLVGDLYINTVRIRTPYEVEVWYDGAGEMYFKGGWSQFAEDHDLHQGFFMTFDYHVGMSKFDVRIYDCTQCQKEYEAEVHFR
jgi:hypothetical protein